MTDPDDLWPEDMLNDDEWASGWFDRQVIAGRRKEEDRINALPEFGGTAPPVPEWIRRLESAVAKNLQRKAIKRAERIDMAERRAYGLAQRYAAKAARNRNQPPKGES